MDSQFKQNKMRTILLICITVTLLASCEKDYQHDTGLADGYHDCSMMDYLRSDHNNWDSIVVAIEYAGLTDIFEGTNPDYKEITFFGPTNMSIRKFFLEQTGEAIYHTIREIPVELVKDMILAYLVEGKKMKETFDYEVKGTLTGGTEVYSLNNVKLRVYRTQSEFNGIPDIGAEGLKIHAEISGQMASIASADIETNNGVVHSLSNRFTWVEL